MMKENNNAFEIEFCYKFAAKSKSLLSGKEIFEVESVFRTSLVPKLKEKSREYFEMTRLG